MDNESKYHYGREIICTLRSCTAISERVYLHWLDKINNEEKLKSHNKDYAELEKLYYQQLRRTDKLEADYEELENQRDELRNALNETMLGYDMWLETNGYSYENYDKYKQLLARIKEGEK